jgi:diketogulonate reductase-like aldo/keto reductase
VVQQGIVAVTKSDNIDHIADDLKVFDFELTGDEMRQLAAVK